MYYKKKYLFLSLIMINLCFLFFTTAVDATENPDDLIAEVKVDGTFYKGSVLSTDKTIIRPVYQGDYSTIFEDVKGPEGYFKGYYNVDDYPNTYQYLQKFSYGDSVIIENIGQYNQRKIALKITSLMKDYDDATIGVLFDGAVHLRGSVGLKSDNGLAYQLVYDEPGYPNVRDVYLDLPNDVYIAYTNSNSNENPVINVKSSNLKKYYLSLPNNYLGLMKRSYSFINRTMGEKSMEMFQLEAHYTKQKDFPYGVPFLSSIVSDNNEQTIISPQSAMAYAPTLTIFKSDIKIPYTPSYLPVRVNSLGNSDLFEANYDVGQTVSDAYENSLPDSLKIIVEDKEGYFKKVDQNVFKFTDKDKKDITDLVTVNKVSDSKLEFIVPKASLKILKTNQINIKLSIDHLNADKVLANFDKDKNVYKVPLTFYNVRIIKGKETQSEETKVNATIIPNIYGEALPTQVMVGTSTKDLSPLDLIKNGVTTIQGDKLNVSFVEDQEFLEAKTYNVNVKLSSEVRPSLSKVISVPVTAVKGKPITSDFFENQSWIINEINRQLSKKIDVDVYEADLVKITKIDLTTAPKIIGEHIPKTIDSLTNLNYLRLANQKLSGVLPEELGNLSKIKTLSIYGNTFDSEIPQSIGKLQELTLLSLDDNNLTGTVPATIASLPKLSQIYLNKNKLSGQLPDFPMNMNRINVMDNQLTYNLATVPSFLTSATSKNYTKTFILGLKLTGNSQVSSQSEQIKPFDETDTGYFDLKAMSGEQTIDLFDKHTYIIKNAVDGTVYYTGKKDKAVTIPYQKGMNYQVILDNAEKNPNNVFTILGKLDEFKFEETPASMSMKIKLGSGKQPVVLNGALAIFDNRENKNWKLSVTPSNLIKGSQPLKGEYSYTTKHGVSNSIVNGEKFLIESGKSDSINEVIPISNAWDSQHGLCYTAYDSNYTGLYHGKMEWTLEDAP